MTIKEEPNKGISKKIEDVTQDVKIEFPVTFDLKAVIVASNSDEENEVGIIEQHNEKVTRKAIEYIKTPIEQAKLAKEAQEKHNRMVEESSNLQE